jgi:predicted NBD/HSP70 family sugar kinase
VVNDRYGVVLVADMGASGLRVAACDISARILAEWTQDSDIAAGPATVLQMVGSLFEEVLDDQGPEQQTCARSASTSPGRWTTGRDG